MRGYVVVGLALGSAMMLGGCAGGQRTQNLKQLESDLGLLDQRVTQLERTSLTGGASAAWPAETSATADMALPVHAATATPKPAGASKPGKRDIQQALKNAGLYQGPVDGKIGPKTRDAVRQFQQVNGLKVDGVVGKETWSKLSAYLDLTAAPDDSTIK